MDIHSFVKKDLHQEKKRREAISFFKFASDAFISALYKKSKLLQGLNFEREVRRLDYQFSHSDIIAEIPISSSSRTHKISKADLGPLFSRTSWLNDECVNGYIMLLMYHYGKLKNDSGRFKGSIHIFNSFFFTTLTNHATAETITMQYDDEGNIVIFPYRRSFGKQRRSIRPVVSHHPSTFYDHVFSFFNIKRWIVRAGYPCGLFLPFISSFQHQLSPDDSSPNSANFLCSFLPTTHSTPSSPQRIAIPINHHNTHWSCGCVDFHRRIVSHIDSMGYASVRDNIVCRVLMLWMVCEVLYAQYRWMEEEISKYPDSSLKYDSIFTQALPPPQYFHRSHVTALSIYQLAVWEWLKGWKCVCSTSDAVRVWKDEYDEDKEHVYGSSEAGSDSYSPLVADECFPQSFLISLFCAAMKHVDLCVEEEEKEKRERELRQQEWKRKEEMRKQMEAQKLKEPSGKMFQGSSSSTQAFDDEDEVFDISDSDDVPINSPSEKQPQSPPPVEESGSVNESESTEECSCGDSNYGSESVSSSVEAISTSVHSTDTSKHPESNPRRKVLGIGGKDEYIQMRILEEERKKEEEEQKQRMLERGQAMMCPMNAPPLTETEETSGEEHGDGGSYEYDDYSYSYSTNKQIGGGYVPDLTDSIFRKNTPRFSYQHDKEEEKSDPQLFEDDHEVQPSSGGKSDHDLVKTPLSTQHSSLTDGTLFYKRTPSFLPPSSVQMSSSSSQRLGQHQSTRISRDLSMSSRFSVIHSPHIGDHLSRSFSKNTPQSSEMNHTAFPEMMSSVQAASPTLLKSSTIDSESKTMEVFTSLFEKKQDFKTKGYAVWCQYLHSYCTSHGIQSQGQESSLRQEQEESGKETTKKGLLRKRRKFKSSFSSIKPNPRSIASSISSLTLSLSYPSQTGPSSPTISQSGPDQSQIFMPSCYSHEKSSFRMSSICATYACKERMSIWRTLSGYGETKESILRNAYKITRDKLSFDIKDAYKIKNFEDIYFRYGRKAAISDQIGFDTKLFSSFSKQFPDISFNSELNLPIAAESDLVANIYGVSSPKQSNGYDCGVFTSLALRAFAFDHPFIHSQRDMGTFRHIMLVEMALGKIIE
ncbi:hypothetical protein ADUPG1_006873 [Aduncisulcus paluster]|uniref:Ubiquitin-like protease family profile domain-containing protein n=1 Tax=Aduncisulcus paluster TaxID=2918883 RepID=A0ABQ5KJW1_9EUKA|nr:hypothetical protein ADUPG1_006873 [Aduncisulcus paluster]